MSSRYLVVLGTASQAPTRDRNQNGYALTWDDRLLLFDPGEGFQRQCDRAGVVMARADALFVTHLHGDHCLGLPGLLHRLRLDSVAQPLPTYFPGASIDVLDHLTRASISGTTDMIETRPVVGDGPVGTIGDLSIRTRQLAHPVPTFGYRFDEPDSTRLDGEQLEAHGIRGRDVAALEADGHLVTPAGDLSLDQFLLPRPGQSMAFVLDTGLCDAALDLADGADLLVCEATFLEAERQLAHQRGHLTAAEAGRLASEAGVRRLVLTHFSHRYDDLEPFAREAGEHHEDVVVATDLTTIEVPGRLHPGRPSS